MRLWAVWLRQLSILSTAAFMEVLMEVLQDNGDMQVRTS
jgi:hypothetical protein